MFKLRNCKKCLKDLNVFSTNVLVHSNSFYPLNELISNLMPATGLKKAGTGQQRAEKAIHLEKIQRENI